MTLGLPGNDEPVHTLELFDEFGVVRAERLTHGAGEHFRPDDGIVLGKRLVAFEFDLVLGLACHGMEEQSLFHRGDQGMPDTTQHGMIGPDRERVFAFLLERFGVVDEHLLAVFRRDGKLGGEGGVKEPGPAFEFGGVDIGVGGGMIAVLIDEEGGVEDLQSAVGVHGGGDVRDGIQVAIDELTQAGVIFHRATSAAPTDKQFEAGEAEGVLHVDQHQPGAGLVL